MAERAGGEQRAEAPDRAERASFWIALAITLVPIPAALLISWALGDSPWDAKPRGPAPPAHQGASHR